MAHSLPVDPTATLHDGTHGVKRSAWLIQRSILVIALIIGFYSFALGLAALLLTVAFVITDRATGGLWLALSCFAGAAAILSALVPRRDPFRPPGPLLEPDEEPHLFAFVKADGQHFILSVAPDAPESSTQPSLTVATNWTGILKNEAAK